MVRESNEELIRRIELLQQGLEELRIEVANRRNEDDDQQARIKIGDKVAIANNIRPYQEREGTVIKFNEATQRVTVKGRRRGGKVVRRIENVRKIEEFS